MAGRRPKPTALKQLAGNPGKRSLTRNEPKPRKRRPRMPAHLSPEAQVEWRRFTRELAAMGLLSSADGDAIAIYCDTYARWVEATREVRERGLVVTTESGFPVQNPYLGIANKCAALMQRLLIEFGMTPAARSRISLPEETPVDEFEQYLKSGAG